MKARLKTTTKPNHAKLHQNVKCSTEGMTVLTWVSVYGFIRQYGDNVIAIVPWQALGDFIAIMVFLLLHIKSCCTLKTLHQLHLGLK